MNQNPTNAFLPTTEKTIEMVLQTDVMAGWERWGAVVETISIQMVHHSTNFHSYKLLMCRRLPSVVYSQMPHGFHYCYSQSMPTGHRTHWTGPCGRRSATWTCPCSKLMLGGHRLCSLPLKLSMRVSHLKPSSRSGNSEKVRWRRHKVRCQCQ